MHSLEHVEVLHNNYFALRHAMSEANQQGLLNSNPKDYKKFDLTEEGREKASRTAEDAKKQGLGREKPLVFIVSPFSRAVITTEIVQSVLGGSLIIDERLSERFFGTYDMQSDKNLAHIWALDATDQNNTEGYVESPFSVQQRVSSLIEDIEHTFEGYDIILGSHGDTLQILQTAFEKIPASRHREVRHLENAELRPLSLRRKNAE